MEAIPDSRKDRCDALALSIDKAVSHLDTSWCGLRQSSNAYRFPKRLGNPSCPILSSRSYDHLEISQYISRMRLAGLLHQEIEFLDHFMQTMPLHDETRLSSLTHAEFLYQREDLKALEVDVLHSAEYHRESITGLDETKNRICDAWNDFLQSKMLEDRSQQTQATEEIKTQAYDSSLLGNWTGTRDRVNRWLLHALGSSEEQANIHRSMLHDPDMHTPTWSRLVLKYWFIDEAACDVELEPTHSAAAVESSSASSLWSSEFHSCRSQFCNTFPTVFRTADPLVKID